MKAASARTYVAARGLLCVNPANAKAFRMSIISAPCILSPSKGSFVASAGAPFAGAKGCAQFSRSEKQGSHTCIIGNSLLQVCQNRNDACLPGCEVLGGRERRICECWTSQYQQRKDVPTIIANLSVVRSGKELRTNLDVFNSIYTACSGSLREKPAPSCAYYHRVRPRNRRHGLRP